MERVLGVGDRLGPLRARFAPVLRPRSGREAAAKRPAHPEKHKNYFVRKGP